LKVADSCGGGGSAAVVRRGETAVRVFELAPVGLKAAQLLVIFVPGLFVRGRGGGGHSVLSPRHGAGAGFEGPLASQPLILLRIPGKKSVALSRPPHKESDRKNCSSVRSPCSQVQWNRTSLREISTRKS